MESKIVLERIKDFQESQFSHPFTCRNDLCSRVTLKGVLKDNDEILLICSECGYSQEVPEVFFDNDWDEEE